MLKKNYDLQSFKLIHPKERARRKTIEEDNLIVSTMGRIFRTGKDEDGEWAIELTQTILKSKKGTAGLKYITLLNGKKFAVHKIMAETFLKPETAKFKVKHKDGNTLNNAVDNLEIEVKS